MQIKYLIIVAPLLAAAPATAGLLSDSRPDAASLREAVVKSTGRADESSGLKRVASQEKTILNVHETPRELPEVPFVDGDGRAMTLSAFKGQVILLNIWATWCVPCRQEMPTLDNLEAKLGGPDFQVVALSIDQGGIPVVGDFYEELGLQNLRIYVDSEMRAPPLLGVVGIPGTLLIDREGREIGRKLGPAEWDSEEVVAEIRRYLE